MFEGIHAIIDLIGKNTHLNFYDETESSSNIV